MLFADREEHAWAGGKASWQQCPASVSVPCKEGCCHAFFPCLSPLFLQAYTMTGALLPAHLKSVLLRNFYWNFYLVDFLVKTYRVRFLLPVSCMNLDPLGPVLVLLMYEAVFCLLVHVCVLYLVWSTVSRLFDKRAQEFGLNGCSICDFLFQISILILELKIMKMKKKKDAVLFSSRLFSFIEKWSCDKLSNLVDGIS